MTLACEVFNSPLPNPKLWNGPTIGLLQTQDTFIGGGWWHDARILGSTGEGIEKEEPKAWKGWWNEQIVELIKLSMEQKDATTVLLTGRSEAGFSDLINRMVRSKGLVFDMVVLKPKAGPNGQHFSSTMAFKQVFLETLMETYKEAEELRLYEDRVKHVKGFREFFMDYNKRQNGIGGQPTRGPITAEVIQVADGVTLLDPVIEAAEVQKIINEHNAAEKTGKKHRNLMIKKTVFYTGYLITNADTQKLLTLANLPPNMPDTEMKYLANNVLITPRPAPQSILDKVGGMGNKLLWEVTGTAVFENKIWAAQVRPVPSNAPYYSENPTPIVVLALRKGARPIDAGKIQNWQPVPQDKAYLFETTVGEKVLLRVEDEAPEEDQYESLFPNKTHKRKHQHDDDNQRQGNGNFGHGRGGGNFNNRGGRGGRGGGNANNNFRGGKFRGGAAGGGGGGGRGGRGRGGYNKYQSLDEAPQHTSQQSQAYNAMAYDNFPPLGPKQNQAQAQNQNAFTQQQQASYQAPTHAFQHGYQQPPAAPQQSLGRTPQPVYGGGSGQQQQGYQHFSAYQPQSGPPGAADSRGLQYY